MVSKASELFPEPETPVITVSWLCGMSSETSFRLWTRAPRIEIWVFQLVSVANSDKAAALSISLSQEED